MKPLSAGSFAFHVAGAAAVVICLCAVFNRYVNPYSVFSPAWADIEDRPKTFVNLRLVKACQVNNIHPRSLILGSSRAETGLDPEHPKWSNRPVYNLGLSNANNYEVRRYFEHACSLTEVKQAVWLLDFTAFLSPRMVSPDFSEGRLGNGKRSPSLWKDAFSALFTWDGTIASFETLFGMPSEKRYLPNGARSREAEDERVIRKGGVLSAFEAYERRIVQAAPSADSSEFSEEAFEDFSAVLDLAQEHSVDLRLAIAPMHFRYLELLDRQGLWETYLRWRSQLVGCLEAQRHDRIRLLDFGGYNRFTMEPVPKTKAASYFYEASHFSMRLGDAMLDLVLSDESRGSEADAGRFGFLIEKDSLNGHLDELNRRRRSFRLANKNQLQQLNSDWDNLGTLPPANASGAVRF